jgi:Protein of unknown function (DUF3237)
MAGDEVYAITGPGDPPQLRFVLELNVTIGAVLDLGRGSSGTRRTVPITGGTFTGPMLSGRVLPGGADWQFVEEDGLTFVDARYVIETDDRVRIEVRNQGVRHGPGDLMARINAGEAVSPDEYYFRTTPRFYPPEGRYDWLRRAVFVGVGERYAGRVMVQVWSIG